MSAIGSLPDESANELERVRSVLAYRRGGMRRGSRVRSGLGRGSGQFLPLGEEGRHDR